MVFLYFLPFFFALRIYKLSAYIAPGCSGKTYMRLANLVYYETSIVNYNTKLWICHSHDVYREKWHFAVKHKNQTIIRQKHCYVDSPDCLCQSQFTQQQLTGAPQIQGSEFKAGFTCVFKPKKCTRGLIGAHQVKLH